MASSYLGLLDAIRIAERNSGVYLKAWADMPADPEPKRALTLVARPRSHGTTPRSPTRGSTAGSATLTDQDQVSLEAGLPRIREGHDGREQRG